MSQTYDPDCFGGGHQAQLDLDKMKNNFAALKSSFSGAASPGNTEAGMLWFHTTNKLLKMRNNANDAWLGVMAADAAHKIFVYRNTAPDGWAIDSTIKDCVLALKTDTGATNPYNYEGGSIRGTWTPTGHTHSSGTLAASVSLSHSLDYFYASGGSPEPPYGVNVVTSVGNHSASCAVNSGATGSSSAPATDRPYAAVGTLQYMNI